MSKAEVTKKLKMVKSLLPETFVSTAKMPTDKRFEQVDATCGSLATCAEQLSYLDQVLAALDDLKKKMATKKAKQSLDFLACEATDDDDECTKPASKQKSESNPGTKTLLENKIDAHKRLCAQKYEAAFGGKGKWRVDPEVATFLNQSSLPAMYKNRLTSVANESPVVNCAFNLLASGKTITSTALQDLGDLVVAETAAKILVIFSAHHKGVKENFPWTETSLQTSLETETKTMTGIALRNAGGSDLKSAASSYGDIFTVKEPVDRDDRDDDRKRQRTEPITAGSKEWWKEKPATSFKIDVKCGVCQGWGHRGGCAVDPVFRGHCSVCHGNGHKKVTCPSK